MPIGVPFHTPVVIVPTVARAPADVKLGNDVKVVFEVAVILAAVPVVFWFNVGNSLAIAAAIDVPLPNKIPVTVVDIVIAGVVVEVATVPAKPLAVTTLTEVTVPVPATAQVPSALKKFTVPPPENGTRPFKVEVNTGRIAFTCATVRAVGVVLPPVLLPRIVSLAMVGS
jgi:hypothetical protein